MKKLPIKLDTLRLLIASNKINEIETKINNNKKHHRQQWNAKRWQNWRQTLLVSSFSCCTLFPAAAAEHTGGIDADVNRKYIISEALGDAGSTGVKGTQFYLGLQGVAARGTLHLVLEGDGAANLLCLLHIWSAYRYEKKGNAKWQHSYIKCKCLSLLWLIFLFNKLWFAHLHHLPPTPPTQIHSLSNVETAQISTLMQHGDVPQLVEHQIG